jgi:hypothetical protein
MCNSYCNSCSYCVSQCTCSNPTLVTPASIPATGCISTNYARCIYYSGNNITCGITATSGDNLDVIINRLATAICNVTPADLAWATFNYQCLREDGSLTSSGPSNITTGKEFAEAVSIALCSLATAADVTPNITISGPCSAYFSGLTPGTSTLVDILDDFIVKLCALNAQNDTSTVTTACSAGLWTSVPAAGSTLGTWVNWIKTNVCSLTTTLQGRVTNLETFESDLYTFVGDSTLSLIDNSTSCISGSGSDNLLTTIGLIKTKLCSINSLVSALPDLSNITLPWGSCPGLFPSYSSTASLVTQLTRLVNEVAARTYYFNLSDFTVSSTACGTTVSLASPGGAFTCSDLNTCSIQNLGDVDPAFVPASQYAVLSWSGTQWTSKTISLTSTGGSCLITSVATPNLTFNVESNIATTVSANGALATPVSLSVTSVTGGTTTLALQYNPSSFIGVGTVHIFLPNPSVLVATAPSAVYTDAGAFVQTGSTITMVGAYTHVAALPAATPIILGTIGAIPVTNRVMASWMLDDTSGAASPVLLTINTVGQVTVTSVLGLPAPATTYTVFFSGNSYAL